MKFSFQTIKRKVKERLWVWQPIVLFTFVGFFAYIFIDSYYYSKDQLDLLHSKKPITKVEIEIGSDTPTTFITITDSAQLDSINTAFQTALKKDIPTGGLHNTRAELNIYKRGKKINLFIMHSEYHGWMIDAAGATLTSEYLFSLVKRYAKK